MNELFSKREARRQQSLAQYRIEDTEPVFDELVRLASQVCQSPMALIALINNDQQSVKASVGIDASNTPGYIDFCNQVVLHCKTLTVPDTRKDERFADHALVTAKPNIRFYSGQPLITSDGSCIGTLAVLDLQARQLSEQQHQSLETLANMVMHTLELQRTRLALATDIASREKIEQALRQSEERYRYAAEASQAALWDYDMRTGLISFSDAFRDMLGYQRLEDMPKTFEEYRALMHPDDRERVSRKAERLVAGETGDRATAEFRLKTQSGQYRWFQSNSKVIRDSEGTAIRRLGSTIDIHERRQAEEQLREQAERMRGMLETASDAIITINERGAIELVNASTEYLFGYTAGELLGNNIRILMTSADRAQHDNHLQRYLDSGESRIMGTTRKLQARRKDGSIFPVRLTVSEVRLADRRIFTGFIQDITSEEQARLALEASEKRFSAVARTTTDVIWELNPDTGKMWWSEGLEKAFGYAPEDVENHASWVVKRIHPEDRERVLATLEKAIKEQAEWHESYRFLHSDGHYAEVIDNAYVITGDDGRPSHMVGGMKDITLQRQSQLKLAEQARLLDKAHDAIFVISMDGIVTYWNQGAERIYGWQTEDMLGASVADRLFPDKGNWEQIMQQLLKDDVWEGQSKHQRADGRHRQMQSHLTLVRDDDHQPVSILAINADVSEKLELEEQLRQAQRMESIGQLTGGVAHDFNNLLTVILGNAELLSDALDSNQNLKPLADMVQSAAHRGADLTRQMLAFARRQALEPQTVNVSRLVRAMRPMLERSMPEHIEIDITESPNPWPARIDPTQLESALLNLVLNARDAMPAGGQLTISVRNQVIDDQFARLHSGLQPGDYLALSVTDSGHGIPPEHMDNLFEPFFTTKETGKGTGLGLAMVYGFIKQSNGHVSVESEVDTGTTVRLYLPRATNLHQSPQRAFENEGEPTGTERILLVEDDPLVRKHVSHLVRQLGYQVSTAADGEEALTLIDHGNTTFDLLFTDVIMPGQLRGPDLAREIRKIQPDIRILFTSGYPEDAITTETEQDEDFHLLQKPYQKAELAQRIREILDG